VKKLISAALRNCPRISRMAQRVNLFFRGRKKMSIQVLDHN